MWNHANSFSDLWHIVECNATISSVSGSVALKAVGHALEKLNSSQIYRKNQAQIHAKISWGKCTSEKDRPCWRKGRKSWRNHSKIICEILLCGEHLKLRCCEYTELQCCKEDHLYRSGGTVNFDHLFPWTAWWVYWQCQPSLLSPENAPCCYHCRVLDDLHPITDELKQSTQTVPCIQRVLCCRKTKEKEQIRSPHFAEKTEYHWSNLVGLKHCSFVQLFVIDVCQLCHLALY